MCWSGMTDTEHSTTSRSNEEEQYSKTKIKIQINTCSNIQIEY